jgi:cell division protein FtsL
MIEPERWYEYQRDYQRYGIDMKPQREPAPRQTRERKTKKVPAPFGNVKKASVYLVLLVGLMMILGIITTAYAASIRYDINKTIKENNTLMGEIENLQAKVYTSNNISYIEGKATGELGMVYSTSENRVYITADDVPEEGFADLIKEKAYN